MATHVIKAKLADAINDGKEYYVEIRIDEQGIYIRPDGYSDSCSNDGGGCPVLFEFANGVPRVVVWGDINQEDYTHLVDLEGAKETCRILPDDDF